MELQFANNTATSSSTGHSPAYLNLGRELKPPGNLAHEVATPETEKRQHRIEKLHAALELYQITFNVIKLLKKCVIDI